MSVATRNPALRLVLARAEAVSRFQGRGEIGADHLLLALMSDATALWPALLERCGVGSYEQAARLSGPLPPRAELAQISDVRVPRPMRRVLVDLIVGFLRLMARLLGRVRRRAKSPSGALLAADGALAVAAAERLAPGGAATPGHLLVALASIPGRQVKLLRREHQLVAAAARREIGLARRRDRLLLALNRPALATRQLQGRLRARGNWRLVPWLAMRCCGMVWALTVFFLETTATVGLYVFLWPALLLANGVRAVVARALGIDFTVRRAHDVVGGELEVTVGPEISDRRIAAAVLLPRLICFLIAVISFTVLFWQSRRLGVQPFPLTVARYDLVQGNVELAQLVAPMLILFDSLVSHGLLAGTGTLAGVGAGLLAIPSLREVQLVRLAGAHDLGGGSLGLRLLVAPLLLAVGALAALEAVLPFRGGPLYVTVYAIPLLLAFVCSGLLGPVLLPY